MVYYAVPQPGIRSTNAGLVRDPSPLGFTEVTHTHIGARSVHNGPFLVGAVGPGNQSRLFWAISVSNENGGQLQTWLPGQRALLSGVRSCKIT